MSQSQCMLYILASLAIFVCAILPSFALSAEMISFDKGKNKERTEIFLDWFMQFLIYCGFCFLAVVLFDAAETYKPPAKNHLVFLSVEEILAEKGTLKPVSRNIDYFNKAVEDHPNVKVVVIDNWAINSDPQYLKKVITEDLKLKVEVLGSIPGFVHKRNKTQQIAAWLQNDKNDWTSITVISKRAIPELDSVNLATAYGFNNWDSGVLEERLKNEAKAFPEIELKPTEIKLTKKPDFGGQRLLKGVPRIP